MTKIIIQYEELQTSPRRHMFGEDKIKIDISGTAISALKFLQQDLQSLYDKHKHNDGSHAMKAYIDLLKSLSNELKEHVCK